MPHSFPAQVLQKSFRHWSRIGIYLLVVLGLCSHAQGQILFSNLSETGNATSVMAPSTLYASSFETGSDPATVTSLTTYIGAVLTRQISVTADIYTNASQSPSALVGSFSTLQLNVGYGIYPVTGTSTGISLNSNTVYWLVYQSNVGDNWQGTSSYATDAGSFSTVPDSVLAVSTNDGASWSSGGSDNFLFSLSGETEAAPEPSAWAMLLLGGLALLGFYRFKGRNNGASGL